MTDPAPTNRVFNVLFLCTHNSARSIMAECILRRWGQGRFNAFSAGSQPRGTIHPMALELLERTNHSTHALRSKDWNEFARPGAPALDFVFTVCDQAAGEVCPVWPGQPMTAHWGIQDPSSAGGTEDEQRKAFKRACFELDSRIKIFASLRLEGLDRLSLQNRLNEIGRLRATEGAETADSL